MEVFHSRSNTYNVRQFNTFKTTNPKTHRFVLNLVGEQANQMWNILVN